MQYLHGIHDPGGEDLHGDKPGWTLIPEEVGTNTTIQGKDYRYISDRGTGVIVRLSHGYGAAGTIPLPTEYDLFAGACANFAATSYGVAYYIIGNEPNIEGERPGNVVIPAENYARCFAMCYAAIKRVNGAALIMPAAMAPYHANPVNWLDYAKEVMQRLAPHFDAVNIHAYTRSMDPNEIHSEAKMEGQPLTGQYSGFRTYRDLLGVVPAAMRLLPAFITEFDVMPGWRNENTGVIEEMYREVNTWNLQQSTQKIRAATCFRWLGPPEVQNQLDWEMRNKPNLLEDFRRAVAIGFEGKDVERPTTVYIPDVKKEAGPVQVTTPRQISADFALRTGGMTEYHVPQQGQRFFALIRADYVPNGAAVYGPDHHILVEVLDAAGNRMQGQQVIFASKDEEWPKVVDKQGGAYGVDFPMYAAGFAYSARVGGADSDKAAGMGLGSIEKPDWGIHVVFYLVFQERIADMQQPVTPPPAQQPGSLPNLVHPVADPKWRRLTQGWAARPDYYRQFKFDGVPLQGHEGLDFGTPVGTPVQAVDAGYVAEVGDTGDTGYGKYIKIIHEWGESLYAHLETQTVWQGQRVNKGQLIGTTGDTGNTDGPHLHFGLRRNGYNRKDGWGGYSDPTPLLERGSTPGPGSSPAPSKSETLQIVKEAAAEFGVDWRLLASLIHGESSFNPASVNSSSGAAGLGQLMPTTWAEWSSKVGASDIFSARDNARVSAAYLAWCIKQAGSVRKGLWAYNWGIGYVLNKDMPPMDTVEFASKVLHGAEVLEIAGA
jgi:hypothetical protein